MNETDKIIGDKLKIIRRVFTDFLDAKGHKKTSERMVILEEICSLDDHYKEEELHHH